MSHNGSPPLEAAVRNEPPTTLGCATIQNSFCVTIARGSCKAWQVVCWLAWLDDSDWPGLGNSMNYGKSGTGAAADAKPVYVSSHESSSPS